MVEVICGEEATCILMNQSNESRPTDEMSKARSRSIEIYVLLVLQSVIVQRHNGRLGRFLAMSDRHVVSSLFPAFELPESVSIPCK